MSNAGLNSDRTLARSMGPTGAIATVVAGTLGAGLFITLGTASATTGPSIILVVAFAGIMAMCIALNYSWIATIFPGAGGAYTYTSRTFQSRLVGFVITWTKWLGYMAADAVLAIGFGSYFQVFFPAIDPVVSGFVLLTVLFVINLIGTSSYSISQNIMFGLLILSILVLIIPGLSHIDTSNYTPFFTGGTSGFMAAAFPLFYAYIGIEVAGQMGAEIKNPGRNMPLAIFGGTLLLTILYLATAIVIYGVVNDYTILANSDKPLVTASTYFLGDWGTDIVTFGGLLATATSVHAVMAAAIKMPYSWSWDNIFPRTFSRISKRFGTPHWSLILLYVISSMLIFWSGGLDKALSIAVFSYLIAYFAVSLSAGYIYATKPELAAKAAFHPGAWFYLPVAVGVFGPLFLIYKALNWKALLAGDFAETTTMQIYIPWLIVGLVVFAIYWMYSKKQAIDVDALLAGVPGDLGDGKPKAETA